MFFSSTYFPPKPKPNPTLLPNPTQSLGPQSLLPQPTQDLSPTQTQETFQNYPQTEETRPFRTPRGISTTSWTSLPRSALSSGATSTSWRRPTGRSAWSSRPAKSAVGWALVWKMTWGWVVVCFFCFCWCCFWCFFSAVWCIFNFFWWVSTLFFAVRVSESKLRCVSCGLFGVFGGMSVVVLWGDGIVLIVYVDFLESISCKCLITCFLLGVSCYNLSQLMVCSAQLVLGYFLESKAGDDVHLAGLGGKSQGCSSYGRASWWLASGRAGLRTILSVLVICYLKKKKMLRDRTWGDILLICLFTDTSYLLTVVWCRLKGSCVEHVCRSPRSWSWRGPIRIWSQCFGRWPVGTWEIPVWTSRPSSLSIAESSSWMQLAWGTVTVSHWARRVVAHVFWGFVLRIWISWGLFASICYIRKMNLPNVLLSLLSFKQTKVKGI